MTLAEATRQYQATLEACRAAYERAAADEVAAMHAELMAAMRQCEIAWFKEKWNAEAGWGQ